MAELSCFSSLDPDGQITERVEGVGTVLDLAEALRGPVPYITLRLTDGVELHYQSAGPEPRNAIATALAARYGFDAPDIRGTAEITGPSNDSDVAQGMDHETFFALYDALAAVCQDLGARLYSTVRPDEWVFVRPTDYAQGDVIWFGGQPHIFVRLVDYPAECETARLIPGAQYILCEDGFTMGATGSWYPTRVSEAPPGYWQRTGNQLLAADS
ncbi:hypothetical protein ACH4PU_35940 [Streptomyces sp. NPDC021100]|uniref:hypothetical protein n=1 Tax=Streptomyces sp. NPDC021100 TaxID=3365114 RepID=UPI00379434C3